MQRYSVRRTLSRITVGALMSLPDFSPPSPPTPPTPPGERECCGRYCEYCVWVYYHAVQRRHETAMAEWLHRYGGLVGSNDMDASELRRQATAKVAKPQPLAEARRPCH